MNVDIRQEGFIGFYYLNIDVKEMMFELKIRQ